MDSFTPSLVLLIIAASSLISLAGPVNLNKAESCDPLTCLLPDCKCPSTDIPGDYNASSIPQIITISIDDAFRFIDYILFYEKVFSGRTNPNGCPIGITYFVTNRYTDYALMEHVYSVDHAEFADHSTTHQYPTTWWTEATKAELVDEIDDQKTIMELWGGIPEGEVKGFRVPFLATSENEIRALHHLNFTYEASMHSSEGYWPFTLDYKSPICNTPATCPEYSYPGLWLVPIQPLDQSNSVCNMLDACTEPKTKQEWVDFLWENFNAHYESDRSPFGLYSHVTWFYLSPTDRVDAMNAFLDKVLALDDVYIVTHSQLIEWVRDPVSLSEIEDFEPWKCPARPAPSCDYMTPTCNSFIDGFLFRSCSSCPNSIPTIHNPEGN